MERAPTVWVVLLSVGLVGGVVSAQAPVRAVSLYVDMESTVVDLYGLRCAIAVLVHARHNIDDLTTAHLLRFDAAIREAGYIPMSGGSGALRLSHRAMTLYRFARAGRVDPHHRRTSRGRL